jgi:hypothetical protein
MRCVRRLRRNLFNLTAILSLLLCVASVALWVRGYWVGDLYRGVRQTLDDHEFVARYVYLESGRATLGVTVTTITASAATVRAAGYVPSGVWQSGVIQSRPPLGATERWLLGRPPRPMGSYWAWTWGGVLVDDRGAGTSYAPANDILFTATRRQRSIVLRCRLVVAMTALAPAWLAFRWARRRTVRPGCCDQCGYDLRATPDRCPECGKPVVTKAGPPSEGLSETEGV